MLFPKPLRRRKPARPHVDLGLLKARVLIRDRECVAAKVGWEHECRDAWGTPHISTDYVLLSLEHVRDESERVPYGGGAMGAPRADDDERHAVALCYGLNLMPPPAELRTLLRAYLASLYVA